MRMNYLLLLRTELTRQDRRMGFREASDAGGTATETPEGAGEDTKRARQGENQAREPGEKTGPRH